MFDIIAIDWGSVRFGLAFGSQESGLVLPCQYDCFTLNIWSILEKELATRKDIKKIVVGIPLTFNLSPTKTTFAVVEFISEFGKVFPNIAIHKINERESTKKAFDKISIFKDKKTKVNVFKHDLNHNSACEILLQYLKN